VIKKQEEVKEKVDIKVKKIQKEAKKKVEAKEVKTTKKEIGSCKMASGC